ncbi:probable serine/threonine-protein kinase SIS8 [Tanacetum coccineum]
MKHLLRKLHIGSNDQTNRLTTDTSSRPTTSSPILDASPSPVADVITDDSNAEDTSFFEEEFQMQLALAISVSSAAGSVGSGQPDAESEQIRAAKQRSLGCSPSDEFLSLRYWPRQPPEKGGLYLVGLSLCGGGFKPRGLVRQCVGNHSLRVQSGLMANGHSLLLGARSLGKGQPAPKRDAWGQGFPADSNLLEKSNDVVNYDEKVMDGFYDVYGITSNSITQGKMPLLADLQAIRVSDNVDYEVILVNRMTDKDLRYLEERVSTLSLECQAAGTRELMSTLIQRIAKIVVAQMGGPVSDADEMLRRWTLRSHALRNLMNTIILPLGCIDVGLSRHRALLFKVLADKINLPCSLVKGSYYTGTDDGAVNLIKIDNGSEYIIDLMGAPGTLIPAEVQSFNLPSFGLDMRNFGYPSSLIEVATDSVSITPQRNSAVGTSGSEVDSSMGTKSKVQAGKVLKKNQTERFEYDFGQLLPSLSRSNEGPSGVGGRTSPAQQLQIKDVSNCVINAAKNPEFAQKLHAVLLTSGETSSDSFLNGNNLGEGESQVRETLHLLDADMLIMPTNEECGVRQEIMSETNNIKFSLPSEYTSESHNEDFLADNSVVNPFTRQEGEGVHKDDKKTKKLNMNLTETSSTYNSTSYTNHKKGISLTAVEWEILWEDLQIGERIGIGSYGEVYRSEWNGTEVAVKKFMNQDISGDALTQFKSEIEIMLRLRHPNVVLFMGAVTRPPNLSILTEFLPRGSLYKLLHRPNVQLDEKRRMRMALDVAKGMNYLHTSNPVIVHRDLKTPNLLVDKNWVVKVCDFGMSRMKHHTFLSSKSTAGTPEWMAPEVLRNEPSNEKCDVFSFGVILWELATLRVPWTEMNSMQVVGAVGFQYRHLDIPETVDPAVARIITDCWHPQLSMVVLWDTVLLRSTVQAIIQRDHRPAKESWTPFSGKSRNSYKSTIEKHWETVRLVSKVSISCQREQPTARRQNDTEPCAVMASRDDLFFLRVDVGATRLEMSVLKGGKEKEIKKEPGTGIRVRCVETCLEIYDETDFKERFGKLVWNMFMEPLEFEGKWSKLVEDFGLQNHKWMTKMFDLRHMWLPAYFIHSPLFGLMRTTSRSESENAFFKNFTNHGSTLVNFMMCFESAMERQCYRQEVLDFRTFDSAPKLHTKLTIEIHACKVYTRTISLLVQKEIYEGCWACQIQEFKKEEGCEIVKVRDIRAGAYRTLYTEEGKETVIQEKDKVVDYKVVRNPEDGSVECTCRHFLRYGFLCRHVFCVLKNCNIEVILIYLDLLYYKNHRIVATAKEEAGTAATATKQEARNTVVEQLTTTS